MRRKRYIYWSDDLVETYNAGLEALKIDNFELAESLFRKALEISPRDEDSLCSLAETFFYQDRYSEAIPYLLQAEKVSSLTPRIAEVLSRCYKGLKDYRSAKRVVNRRLKQAECAQALYRLGDIHRLQYNYYDAIDCYRAVMVIDDHDIGAYYHVHECLIDRGWFVEALEIARKAIRRWPDDIDFHINLIDALRENGQLKEALKRIDIATEKFGPRVDIYLQLAEVYDAMKLYDDAIAACHSALELEPDDTDTLILMGISYDHSGDFTRGVAQFRRVIELDPTNDAAHSNLGVALEGLGNLEAARLAYEHAISLEPRKPKYRHNLKSLMKKIKTYDN